ncbi:MAG: hypothetical protein QXJ75_06200 [Candidatus Bathyarchaeia archaeon]
MKKTGYIDFSVSGTALLSACIVLRLQSELILKLEEPPPPPVEKPAEFIPPPIQLPFRYEYTSTTLGSLIEALEEAIKAEASVKPAKPQLLLSPPTEGFQDYDRFFIEISDKLKVLYEHLREASSEGFLTFSKIVRGKDRAEVILTFLLLLFLATDNLIELSQREEGGEIYITLVKEPGKSGPNITI